MTQLWSGRAGIWTQEVNLQSSGPSRAAVSSWVLWWWSVLCEVCYGSHNHRWLLGTWNVASAAENLNFKFYLILNGHMWLVAMILDHIVVESNNFQNSIREVVVSFREEYSEHQWNWGGFIQGSEGGMWKSRDTTWWSHRLWSPEKQPPAPVHSPGSSSLSKQDRKASFFLHPYQRVSFSLPPLLML